MITEEEVLRVLVTHGIRNSDSMVSDLGLKSTIDVRDFTPFDYQLKLLTHLINKIVNEGIRILVLNLPTGAGKSYISTALTILIDYFQIKKISPISKSVSLTFRNNLFSQYEKSFKFMYSIKGKSNYKCLLNYAPINNNTLCIKKKSEDCSSRYMCEYFLQRSNFFKSKSLITNYNWYIYNFLSLDIPSLTGTLVLDEVHTLFNIIDDIFNPDTSRVRKILEVIFNLTKGLDGSEAVDNFEESIYHDLLVNGNFKAIYEILEQFTEIFMINPDLSVYVNKYEDLKNEVKLLGLVDDFNIPRHLNRVDRIKYVFSKITSLHNPSKVKIFMSATITHNFYNDSFHSGDEDKLLYYSMDPIFKVENRQIVSFKKIPSVNFNSLKDPEFLDNWTTMMKYVMEFHKNEKGFIYVNSYDQVRILMKYLGDGPRFIYNDKASNSKSTLDKFMAGTSNEVYISPNIKEGYSFDDDISRFQIIAKIPYLNSNVISQYGEEYYYNSAVVALLQIYGRSTRTPTDWSKTYLLDGSWKRLKPYLPKWFLESIHEK